MLKNATNYMYGTVFFISQENEQMFFETKEFLWNYYAAFSDEML